LSQKPYFVYDEKQKTNYENFVNTQFAIIRSPLILAKALESPDISQLPVVKSKKDKIAWLAQKLELKRQNHSEMITISITLPIPEDAEKIVNSVVNAFFESYDNQLRDWNIKLLTQLSLELNRQKTTARLLQDEIRSGLEQAAKQGGSGVSGAVQDESILRELHLNKLKLETLRAELRVLRETLNNPSELEIPAVIIQAAIENDPALILLQNIKTADMNTADINKVTTPEDVTKIPDLQQQIKDIKDTKDIEKTIEKNKGNTEIIAEVKKKLQTKYVLGLEQKFFDVQIAVRLQEIITEDIRRKYNEYIAGIGSRTVQIVNVQFQQDQLRRVNLILDQLESRVIALETERYAPNQIQLRKKATIPTQPNRW
jgi:hypothetical protein